MARSASDLQLEVTVSFADDGCTVSVNGKEICSIPQCPSVTLDMSKWAQALVELREEPTDG